MPACRIGMLLDQRLQHLCGASRAPARLKAGALRSNRRNDGYVSVTAAPHRSCSRACPSALALGPTDPRTYSEYQAITRLRSFGSGPASSEASRFSIAGTDHLFGIFGYRWRPPGCGVRSAYKLPLRRMPSSLRVAGFALGRVSGPDYQVTVVSTGLPAEGDPPREERVSRTGESQSEVWMCRLRPHGPLFQDGGPFWTTGDSVLREVMGSSHRGLAIFGCNLS